MARHKDIGLVQLLLCLELIQQPTARQSDKMYAILVQMTLLAAATMIVLAMMVILQVAYGQCLVVPVVRLAVVGSLMRRCY